MGELANQLRSSRGSDLIAYDSDPLGFLSNLFEGVVDLGKGLTGLLSAAGKDVWSLGREAVSRGESDPSFAADDILLNAVGWGDRPSVVLDDFKRRYGPLLPGGRPAGETAQMLYEEPVSFGLDALTVATGGGAAAAKGAASLSKVAGVSDDLTRLARAARTADEAADISRTARFVDKVLPGAKEKALLQAEGLADEAAKYPLGGLRNVLDPAGRAPLTKTRHMNPVRRSLREGVEDAIFTQPVSRILDEIESLTGEPSHVQAATRKAGDETLAMVDEFNQRVSPDQAITRKYRPQVANRMVARTTNKLLGSVRASHLEQRDRFDADLAEVTKQLSKEELADLHVRLEFDTLPSNGAMPFEQIKGIVDDEALATTPKLLELRQIAERHVNNLRTMEASLSPDDPRLIKARRYVESLSEAAMGEGKANAALSNAVDDIAVLRDRDITSTFQDYRVSALDDPVEAAERLADSYDDIFERAYDPMRRAARRELGVDSLDEVPSALKIDEAMQAQGRKMPQYFPHISTIPSSRSSFVMKVGGQTRGIRTRSKSKGWSKDEGVLTEDFLNGIKDAYQTDPREAFVMRASEAARWKETNRFINELVGGMGMKVDARSEVPKGWELINLDGVNMAMRKREQIMEAAGDLVEEGKEVPAAFVDSFKEAFRGLTPEEADILAGKSQLYAIPKSAAKQMQQLTRMNIGGWKLRLGFDGPVNLWRANVLYLRPDYYFNNVFGNTTFLKLQGGKMTGVLRQLSNKHREAVREAIGEKNLSAVEQGFFGELQQRRTHLGAALDESKVARGVQRFKDSPVGRGAHAGRMGAQHFNSGLENLFRRESFLTAVEKQASKRGIKLAGNSFFRTQKRLDAIMEFGADENIAKAALDDLGKAMNNYTELAPWEQHILRRFLMPFWPFYKHAAKTLASLPFSHPAKADIMRHLSDVNEKMLQEGLGDRPGWLESAVPLGPGDDPGEVDFFNARAWNPIGSVAENPLGLLNPFIQTALEQSTGQDPFTGKPFTAEGIIQPFGSSQSFKMNEEGEMAPLERSLGGLRAGNAPSLKETLTGFFPAAGLARDVLPGGGARYSATGEVIKDDFGDPLYPSDPAQELLNYLTPASTTTFNLGRYQEQNAENAAKALEEYLQRAAQ